MEDSKHDTDLEPRQTSDSLPATLSGREAAFEQSNAATVGHYEATEKTTAPAPTTEPHSEVNQLATQEDYSVFTVWQKRWIILLASFAGWFSPMTGSIYFPALDQIADDLHVSNAKVNITVTTYLVSGILACFFDLS